MVGPSEETDRRTPRTQQERVTESTSRLLDAAVDLLIEQAWTETTAAQIAERAGYSREMVRLRFGSKDGVLDHLMGQWEGLVLRGQPNGLNGLARIVDRIDALEELLVGRPKLARAIISYTFQSVGNPIQRAHLVRWIAELADETRKLIEAGRADGSIAMTVDPPSTAHVITDRALGLVLRWLVDPDATVAVDLAAWRDLLVRTLADPDGG